MTDFAYPIDRSKNPSFELPGDSIIVRSGFSTARPVNTTNIEAKIINGYFFEKLKLWIINE